MRTAVLVPRAGSALAGAAHAQAADRHLQERLRLFYGVSAVAIVGFFLLMQGVDLAVGAWSIEESLLDPSQVAHATVAFGMFGLWIALRRRAFGRTGLRAMDAAALLLVVAGSLIVYSESYADELSPLILTVLCIFVIARAIVVPARALQTLVLSLSAPLGVLCLQLLRGPQPFVAHDPHAPAYVVWNQAVLLFAVAIATLAARVTFHLRLRAAEAQRLGEYRIEALLGQGGMGRVFRATHALLRRPAAIKVLDPEITSPATLMRFEQEVRLTSRLQHPGNVQIYDYGMTADGMFYYAMEYLEGMDLHRVLEVRGPLPVARLLHVLQGTCEALIEAHDLGLVHRDLKPANLMLCRRAGAYDVVKVLDYGIAREVSVTGTDPTSRRELVGTPDYMAPEIIREEPAGLAADIYSLGATAYQLLTGWRVFGAQGLGEQLAHHLYTEPIPPSRRLADVPPDLEAVILRCLAKAPEGRYADARALGEALAACRGAGTWTQAEAAAWWEAPPAAPVADACPDAQPA